jgi:trimeric autotransporter adhesin
MVLQTPLILISGVTSQLPPGDLVPGQDVYAQASGNAALVIGTDALASGNAALTNAATALASGNSALIVGSNALASGNAALTNAATALASGNAALVSADSAATDALSALASGNSALAGLTSKVSKGGDVISGTLVVTSQAYGAVSSTVSSGVILINFAAANNFDITLEGNSTLAPSVAPSGGQSGAIFIRQDSVGSRTLAYSGGWSFANGSAPTLTTTASGTDLLAYYAAAPTAIVGNLIAAVSGV